ncbi:MAG: tRNA 2-thiocytidine(32) synthetase TtcA [Proteobacteria bacterium]|nr:tRNA 2-thiocytidine(32) synthetase TtcA [Pseudomonadota bacterium]MBU1743108.1 tRNA 2-thiocytidine(32) synthetase TtcA [Pseudomonadota bacterium]
MAYWDKQIHALTGRALQRYGMLAPGDRVLIGVSGGKDSLTLLDLMLARRKVIPFGFEVLAAHVHPGTEDYDPGPLIDHFQSRGVEYRLVDSDAVPRAHSTENRESPCFLCAQVRRTALFKLADELGCAKLALAHHKDDVIETLFLNMLYAGNVSTMRPMQELFGGRLHLIRPLVLVDEAQTRRYAREFDLPVTDACCPSSGRTRRDQIKAWLDELYRGNRKIKQNLFAALQNVRPEYLWPPA